MVRPLKRLLDTWDRNGSTSGPTPWKIYDDKFCTQFSKNTQIPNFTKIRPVGAPRFSKRAGGRAGRWTWRLESSLRALYNIRLQSRRHTTSFFLIQNDSQNDIVKFNTHDEVHQDFYFKIPFKIIFLFAPIPPSRFYMNTVFTFLISFMSDVHIYIYIYIYIYILRFGKRCWYSATAWTELPSQKPYT